MAPAIISSSTSPMERREDPGRNIEEMTVIRMWAVICWPAAA